MGASLTPNHANFSFGCDFMVGLGKPKQCTKLEVPSFSRCVNIKAKHQNFEELLYPKAITTFSCGCDFCYGLWQIKLCTKFEVARFSQCANIEGKLQKFLRLL